MNHYSDNHTDTLLLIASDLPAIMARDVRAAVAAYIVAVQALEAIAATNNLTHARDYAGAALAAMKRGA
jgi:hypothetical protein